MSSASGWDQDPHQQWDSPDHGTGPVEQRPHQYGQVQPYVGHPVQPTSQPYYAPTPMAVAFPQPYKDTTAAWLLWFFLGQWGAHDFYLRRTGSGVAKLILTLVGVTTVWLFIGAIPLLVVFVWWVVDAVTMGERLQQVNAEVYAHNRAIGAAR